MTSKQIKTYGTNFSQSAYFNVNSRDVYDCANSSLTRGVTGIPANLDECFDRFEGIKQLATILGFIGSSGACGSAGGCGACGACGDDSNILCGGSVNGSGKYGYTLWVGATLPNPSLLDTFTPVDMYLDEPSTECDQITSKLGLDWLGCLWGTPDAEYSCTCPDIAPNFANYLKLRLNVATFWNTPKATPVLRAEFLDAFKYGQKLDFTVAGDFKLKIGQVVYVNVNAASGYPYSSSQSSLNGYYYIIGVKHVVTQSSHETALSVSRIPPTLTSVQAGSTFAADYI